MAATPIYTWPAAGLQPQGWAIIDGVTGAVIKQAGGIFGTFSHVAAGQVRVGLTIPSIAESDGLVAVIAMATDAGGAAANQRSIGYSINAAGTPPELNLWSRDSAGVLADAVRITVLVFAQIP